MRLLGIVVLLTVGCAPIDHGDPLPLPLHRAGPPLTLAANGLGTRTRVTLAVSGGQPGQTAYFGASTVGAGAGPCPPALGGECLGIRQPILLGSAVVGASGTAALTVNAPLNLPPLWLQAAVAAGAGSSVSPVLTHNTSAGPLTVDDLGPGDLVITEVMPDPTRVSDARGEWFEVRNDSGAEVDLDGLVVRDQGSDRFTVAGSVTVPAGGLVVFGASGSSNGGVPVDVVWSGLILGNADDELELVGPAGVIDGVDWDDGVTWPRAAGVAMALDAGVGAAGNDDGPSWCAAGGVYGSGDLGSPGVANPACSSAPGCVNGPDLDHDGVNVCRGDCDDLDPRSHPGAPEACDGLDNDCNGSVPFRERDSDGDGLPDCDTCDEAGFATGTQGRSGAALRAAITSLVAPQDCRFYSQEKAFLTVVLDKDAAGRVEGIYTGVTVPVGATEPDPLVLNIEHAWPQSMGTGVEPARCDLHHLFAVEPDANQQRSNTDFGEVGPAGPVFWQAGGTRLGRSASGATVFEPRDVVKGDIARAMLYVRLRHGLPMTAAQQALFQAWDALDPVDAHELRRSWIIEDRQGVANPFVVCAGLSARL